MRCVESCTCTYSYYGKQNHKLGEANRVIWPMGFAKEQSRTSFLCTKRGDLRHFSIHSLFQGTEPRSECSIHSSSRIRWRPPRTFCNLLLRTTPQTKGQISSWRNPSHYAALQLECPRTSLTTVPNSPPTSTFPTLSRRSSLEMSYLSHLQQ